MRGEVNATVCQAFEPGENLRCYPKPCFCGKRVGATRRLLNFCMQACEPGRWICKLICEARSNCQTKRCVSQRSDESVTCRRQFKDSEERLALKRLDLPHHFGDPNQSVYFLAKP